MSEYHVLQELFLLATQTKAKLISRCGHIRYSGYAHSLVSLPHSRNSYPSEPSSLNTVDKSTLGLITSSILNFSSCQTIFYLFIFLCLSLPMQCNLHECKAFECFFTTPFLAPTIVPGTYKQCNTYFLIND